MFELMFTRARSVLRTTRVLARRIRQLVREMEEEKFDEYVEKLLEDENTIEKDHFVDAVVKDVDDALKTLDKGEKDGLELERAVTMFVLRNVKFVTQDMEAFEKLREDILKKDLEAKVQLEKPLNALLTHFKNQQKQILTSIETLARVTKDKHTNDARLRDELFTVFASFQDRYKAAALRRIFKENKRASADEEKIMKHLDTLVNHGKATTDEIFKALKDLNKDLTEEDGVLNELFASIEFIIKMAVRLYFNLHDKEEKIRKLEEHLSQLRFPASYLEKWSGELNEIDKMIEEGERDDMRSLFQLLHKVKNEQTSALR